MKILSIIFVILFSSSLMGFDIDSHIEEVKKAPMSERFKLMNILKEEISKMHLSKRVNAIEKLTANMNIKHNTEVFKGINSTKEVDSLDIDTKNLKIDHEVNEMEHAIPDYITVGDNHD